MPRAALPKVRSSGISSGLKKKRELCRTGFQANALTVRKYTRANA